MTPWQPERIKALRQLWAAGLSASEIAERLGMTRGQVTAKVHRLGLTGRAEAARAKSLQRRRSAPSSAAQRPKSELASPPLPLPEPAAEDVARIAFVDLEPGHCRWAVGDPAEVGALAPLFCGATKRPGLPYCDAHAARAYRTPQPSRPALPAPASERALASDLRRVAA
jgi:GcrA cell cycle regulator